MRSNLALLLAGVLPAFVLFGASLPAACAPAPGPALAAAQDPEFDAVALQKKVDEITPRVAELRGWEFKRRVKAGVKTPEQFLEFAMADFEEEYGMEEFQAISEAYGFLGLVEPDMDLLQTVLDLLKDQVGGWYDPDTETFYMVSTFNMGMMADIIMAHELTHALDDQYFPLNDLVGRASENSDYEFGVRATVEGSGTSLMNLYTMRGMMEGWIDPNDGIDEMMELMEEQSAVLEEAPPYLVMTLALPYLLGNKFLTRKETMMEAMMAVPDEEDLKRAFREPPLSSEQVIHFEKYWDPEQRDDPTKVVLPDVSAQLGEGWALADDDTIGELGCFVLTSEYLPNLADANAQLMAKWTNDAATGWDGDLYQYYRGPDGRGLVVWVSVWDSEDDATEFAAGLEQVASEKNSLFQRAELADEAVIAWFAKRDDDDLKRLQAAVKQARPDWK